MKWHLLASLLVGSIVMGAAQSQAGEAELVKYRASIMETIGGHMSAIVAIVKGEVPYKDELAYHAESLAKAAPKALPAFEARAITDKSEALPKIWEQWAAFEKSAATFEEASTKFSAAVAGGKMADIGPALGALGKSCKGCHDEFMKEH